MARKSGVKTNDMRLSSVRLPPDLQRKVERIAHKNHLSVSDVIRISLFQIIPVIEKQGITINPGQVT